MSKPLMVILMTMFCVASFGADEQSLLLLGVTGSVGSSGKTNPTYVMRPLEVQRLLLEIAEEPQTRAHADAALVGSEITVDDLLALRLLREDAGTLVINFNFLTQPDQAEIVRVASRHAAALAQSFLQHREEIEEILAKRKLSDVAAADYAYILIGCFSLDWDGLLFTNDPRFRAGATHRSENGSYTPWAKERGDAVSLKRLFWGSHNEYLENVNLTTFGDHHSLPRAAFPDLGWRLRVESDRLPGDGATREVAARVVRRFLKELSRSAAEVMLSLGTGPKSVEELMIAGSLDAETISDLLLLLKELEYIAQDGAKYRAIIPVLTDADTPMVQELLALGREVIREWHDAHFESLASDLGHITPMKYGVPYAVVYTEVWHYVFALTNQKLIEAGLAADPYADSRRFKGFIPAVWRPGQERLDADTGQSLPPT
jgi:hypothetical protein